jgi:hypothetical protein
MRRSRAVVCRSRNASPPAFVAGVSYIGKGEVKGLASHQASSAGRGLGLYSDRAVRPHREGHGGAGSSRSIFKRAIENGNVLVAEMTPPRSAGSHSTNRWR